MYLPPSSICTPPRFLMTSITSRRLNPNGFCLPLVHQSNSNGTVKVLFTTPWLIRHFPPAVRIVVIFRILGWYSNPLTTDKKHPKSTNATWSTLLIFTFIAGSTFSSLCGEIVMLGSRLLSRFPNTSMWHVLVVAPITAYLQEEFSCFPP